MPTHVEYLILGSGPAGLQLGYFLKRSGRNYLIIEAEERPGAFFRRFPRHRKLISVNKVHTGFSDPEKNLRWDWNSLLCDNDALLFKNFTQNYWPHADVLIRYLEAFARQYDLAIQCNTRIIRIERKPDNMFILTDMHGETYSASCLVIATGISKPYLPPIPGIDLAEPYTEVSIKPEDFIDKRVLIIGKGNSAFECADNINETAALIHLASPNSIKMAWSTHFVGNLRSVNNTLLDSYQLKLQNAILDATVDRIERRGNKLIAHMSYTHAHGEREELTYDRIITCTGFRFDTSPFGESAMPVLTINDRFPAQTSEWESTNIPEMYFVGALTQARDFKKTSSGFIHGFRYNTRALAQILDLKRHGKPLPYHAVEPTPFSAATAVLNSINRSSAIWQQFGFLGDVLHTTANGAWRYYEALPIAYVHEKMLTDAPHYFVVTLEYGDDHSVDPFQTNRIARDDIKKANLSQFLHPVIRCYQQGRLMAAHHIIEDLEAAWIEDIHTRPLQNFFEDHFPP